MEVFSRGPACRVPLDHLRPDQGLRDQDEGGRQGQSHPTNESGKSLEKLGVYIGFKINNSLAQIILFFPQVSLHPLYFSPFFLLFSSFSFFFTDFCLG